MPFELHGAIERTSEGQIKIIIPDEEIIRLARALASQRIYTQADLDVVLKPLKPFIKGFYPPFEIV